MATWFHHPGLVVRDVDAASAFYCAALGFTFLRDADWELADSGAAEAVLGIPNTAARCRLLKGANGFLELFQFLSPPSVGDPAMMRACDLGIAHLGFQVTDIDAAFDQFIAAGGTAHTKPQSVGDGRAIYCRDPFGNIVELMQLGADEPDFDLRCQAMLPEGR